MAHKLKIELDFTDPKIYRTVIVPEQFTFHELHIAIQCVMNWENAHLYQFNLGQPYASDIVALPLGDEDDFDAIFGKRFERFDSEETYLSDFFNGQKNKVSYIYDFGDDWFHTIKVLKKPKEEVMIPQCIKGENAAPIDDCGGIPGFYEILEVMEKKRKSPEDKELFEWCGIPKGKTYEDIYGFDIDWVNQVLREVFGPIGGEGE